MSYTITDNDKTALQNIKDAALRLQLLADKYSDYLWREDAPGWGYAVRKEAESILNGANFLACAFDYAEHK